MNITIAAEGGAPAFCGMVVHFDDGSESRNVKIDGKEGKFPVSISRTYAKAGSYSIKEGRAESAKADHFLFQAKIAEKAVIPQFIAQSPLGEYATNILSEEYS